MATCPFFNEPCKADHRCMFYIHAKKDKDKCLLRINLEKIKKVETDVDSIKDDVTDIKSIVEEIKLTVD